MYPLDSRWKHSCICVSFQNLILYIYYSFNAVLILAAVTVLDLSAWVKVVSTKWMLSLFSGNRILQQNIVSDILFHKSQ